jgi:hypothetical protein
LLITKAHSFTWILGIQVFTMMLLFCTNLNCIRALVFCAWWWVLWVLVWGPWLPKQGDVHYEEYWQVWSKS